MWAYVTYISVNDDVYHTFGMLIPWILVFGYLRNLPNWGYSATVGAFTPVLICLGRIPYGDSLPAGNYALLRIEENLVGIAVAIVLTLSIFPVFAIDILKNNIQGNYQLRIIEFRKNFACFLFFVLFRYTSSLSSKC